MSRNGLAAIHCQSRRAVSKTADSNPMSRSIVPDATLAIRASRQRAMFAVVTSPSGNASGSAGMRSRAPIRFASQRAQRLRGVTSSR